jgi:hypothetical protein
MKNLNREIKEIRGSCTKGLLLVAIEIRRTTEKKPPLTPVDLGNLRSSFFVVSSKGKAGNDQWNTGFKSSKKGSKSKVDAGQMSSEHSASIAESIQMAKLHEAVDNEVVILGYSANYAAYVHEKERGADFKRDGSGPKWFETAVKEQKNVLLQIVKDNIKI